LNFEGDDPTVQAMNTTATTHVFDTTSERFPTDVLERSRSVLVAVDFWAAWCGPCRALAPMLEQLVEQYGGRLHLARVDVDANPQLSAQFGIRSIPDVRFFKDGKLVDGFVGVHPLPRIQAIIDRHVPRPVDPELSRARDLLKSGDAKRAAALLRPMLEKDPGNVGIRIDLAEAMARQGNVAATEDLISALPAAESSNRQLQPVRARLHFLKHAPPAHEVEALRRRVRAGDSILTDDHSLAAHELLDGDAQRGIDLLLGIMQKDRKFEDDLGRRSLLQAFSLLGEEDERTKQARRRMAGLLH
jgi:putative thioredoxin